MNNLYYLIGLIAIIVGIVAVAKYRPDLLNKTKWRIRKHFYTPKDWLVFIIPLLVYEGLTRNITEYYNNLTTEFQLLSFIFIVTFVICILVGVAESVVKIMYEPRYKYLTVSNPDWGGEIDVLRAGEERFDRINCTGGENLHEKPTPPGAAEMYLSREYDPKTDTAIGTWKALRDPIECEDTIEAVRENNRLIREEIDKAREVRKSKVAWKEKMYDAIFADVVSRLESIISDDGATTIKQIDEEIYSYNHYDQHDDPKPLDEQRKPDSDRIGEDTPIGELFTQAKDAATGGKE